MTAPTVRRSPVRTANPYALAVIVVGAVLGVLALTVLDWFHGSVGLVHGSSSTVNDIGGLIDRLVDTRRALGDRHAIRLGLSDYYYDWLAWVLLGAAVLVGVVATRPTAEGGQVRALGGILAGLGVLATLWAFDVYRAGSAAAGVTRGNADYFPTVPGVSRVPQGPGYGAFFSHLAAGAWCALAAFVLIGVGAVLGPRRARD